jgi:cell division control protein 6
MNINKNVLEDVFNKFLNGSQIFKDREAMRPDYIPSYLPHREDQVQQIGSIIAPVLRGFRGSNIFIYGQTGTGKTAVVKYILDHLLQKSEEIGVKLVTCYVNCRLAGTDYRILMGLCASLGVNVPFTGLATTEVLNRFKVELDAKKTMMIAVLDEIDSLVKIHGDELLYDLIRINENIKKSKTSIIGISNDLRFKELLDPRVLSSLSEEEVVFRPYSAPELTDILLERAKISFMNNVLSDGALNLVAALAAAEHGDARRALDLLRVAGETAEREGSPLIKENHVREAQKKVEHDRISIFLKALPLHSKIIICVTYLIRKMDIDNKVTGDVYEIYQELCKHIGVEELTQRRVSALINELDINGIINCKIVSLGRYGRTKKIRLGIPISIIREVYSDDPWTVQLLDYTPKNFNK